MKLRIPEGATLGNITVEGKHLNMDKERCVSVSNELSKESFLHLLSMGWKIADDSARRKALDLNIKLGSDGQPVPGQHGKAAIAGKK